MAWMLQYWGTALRISFGLLTRGRELLATPSSCWKLSMCLSPQLVPHRTGAGGNAPCSQPMMWGQGHVGLRPSSHENPSSLALDRWEWPNSGTPWKARHLAPQVCTARPTEHSLPGNKVMIDGPWPQKHVTTTFNAVRKPPWRHKYAQNPRRCGLQRRRDININPSSREKRRSFQSPSPSPNTNSKLFKALLVRRAFPLSAHKQFTSTLQAIDPVVFIQAVFTLAVDWQGYQGPQDGALTAPASQQLMHLVIEKVQFLVHAPCQARPIYHTPRSPERTQRGGRGTWQRRAELCKLRRGHTVPRFYTKNLINITFQNLLPGTTHQRCIFMFI